METQILNFPILNKVKNLKSRVVETTSSCCSQPATTATCCTPSKSVNENNGACCAQPADGSDCCEKVS